MNDPGLLDTGQAVRCLQSGGVIAYPTEAVYGLGCDPGDERAVQSILRLKSRPAAAGLILIGDCLERFEPFIEPAGPELLQRALDAWPGPVCRSLCEAFGGAIVSTSANPGGFEPARNAEQVRAYFPEGLCGIVEGELGDEQRPSEIRDLASGRVLRAGG